MARLRSLTFGLLIFGAQLAAADLKPILFLNKITIRLTGDWPTPEQYDELRAEMAANNCQEVACLDNYFRKKIKEMTDTKGFFKEFTLRVYERFSYKMPTTTEMFRELGGRRDDHMHVARLLFYNEPLDSLFTSQKTWRRTGFRVAPRLGYGTSSGNENFFIDGEPRVRREFSPASGAMNESQILELDYSGHLNLSGMFTTEKFLERYWNSPVNQNRKRSAAVFRIMMCDKMSPALERQGQSDRENNLALGIPDVVGAKVNMNKHAGLKDCAQCHNKIDPLAWTMTPVETDIASEGIAGRIHYTDFGRTVNVKVSNFHEAVVALTQQPAYVDCQVQWLVDSFLGRDLKMHPLTFEKLAEQFNAVGRRVKDFMPMLMMVDEFRGIESKYKQPPILTEVHGVLSACMECHAPFLKKSPRGVKSTLVKISSRLDLAHDGQNRSMPPRSHWWEPSAQEIQSIKNWILQGAPLTENHRTLTDEEIGVVLSGGQNAK